MSNNTISTNISISNNSTDQMMESLSLKRSETLHISDPEKNSKPGKRINYRLFCCGFFFGLISTILIFAVTLYVFDYMGTIVLNMPYSPWNQHQRSSSINRTISNSYSHPDGSSLIHDENSGHLHSHHAHHQQQQFDPISRSYVLPDRFNSTSTINSLINNQVNNSLPSTQSNNLEPDRQQVIINSGDHLVNPANDIDVITSHNETLKVQDNEDNDQHHDDINDDNNNNHGENDDSSHVSPPFEPIQFDDSASDSLFNTQVRRDGKTIDLSQRSTTTTSTPDLIPVNVTINHHRNSSLSSNGTSVEMMIMETSNLKDNVSTESEVSLTSPDSEITLVSREILNYTDNQHGRITFGPVEGQLLNSTNDQDESLPLNISTVITIGFIENIESSTINLDESKVSHENRSTISTESPITDALIDNTTIGQPLITNKMTIGISLINSTTNQSTDQSKSSLGNAMTLNRSNSKTESSILDNFTESTSKVTQSSTSTTPSTIKLTPTTLTTTTTVNTMTQSNEPFISLSTPSTTITTRLSESDTQSLLNPTINPNNQTTVKEMRETHLKVGTITEKPINESLNQTRSRIDDLSKSTETNGSQLNPLIDTRKIEITLTTTPLTANNSDHQTSIPLIKSQSPPVSATDDSNNKIIASHFNHTDHLNPIISTDHNSTQSLLIDNLTNVNTTQSPIHPVERSIIDNSTLNTLENLPNEPTINGSSIDIDKLSRAINDTNLNNGQLKANLTNLEQETNSTLASNYLLLNETESVNGSLLFNATNSPVELISNLNESLVSVKVDSTNETYNTMESMIGTTVSPLECNSKQIRCFINQDKEACLSADVICDGVRDCTDGSDESDCSKSCGSNFRCGNESSVTCISRKYLCDGLMDCDDGSDESSCYFASCENSLSCADKSSCLLPIQVCDGKYDCRDHSDEQECVDHSSCLSVGKFFCDNICIEYSLRCDGSKDCNDGTDESNCTCTSEEFKCWNGDCIDKTLVCDGQANCHDSSDEWSCVKTDENNVVSMINPSTGNWALLCADESPLGEYDYSLLCQKMGLESAVNHSTSMIKTIGQVEWVIHNGSNVIPIETCNSSSILMLECQTFKCSMMATPLEPPTPSSTQVTSTPSSTSTHSPIQTPSPLTTVSPITESSLNATSINTTTSTNTTTTQVTTMATNTTTSTTSSTPLISTSTSSPETPPLDLSLTSAPTVSTTSTTTTTTTTTTPKPTVSSPSSTIEASLLAIPAINYNVPLSRPTRAASPNEIQSMVIVKGNGTDKINKKRCLAQIISPMWLLSSAECLKQLQDIQGLIVEANTSRFLGIVNQVILHPHTSKFRYLHIRDFDLALINLKSPLPLSSSVMSSICLPESDVASDITCFMSVLGETEARPYLIQDRSLCNDRRHFNSSLNQRQICSSASDESPDYVPDPGSNLVCLSSSTEWFIGGFVSFSSSRTSYTKHPSVFSNVFAMKDFINRVIAVNLYQSKMESPFNYTFDLTSSLENNETTINNNNNNSSLDSNNESGKIDNLIATTVTHDNLKQSIDKYSTNTLLSNVTENITINQHLIDLVKIADRSRSLNLDFPDNSSSMVDYGSNSNQTINGSSLITNTTDQSIGNDDIVNNQTIPLKVDTNDRQLNRSEYGRSIEPTNTFNQIGTINNQSNTSTIKPLTHPSILKNDFSEPTTSSLSSMPSPSSTLSPTSHSSSSSSTISPLSPITTSSSASSSTSSPSSTISSSLSPGKADKTTMMIMETSTGPTTLGAFNYHPQINDSTTNQPKY